MKVKNKKKAIRTLTIIMVAMLSLGVVSSVLLGRSDTDHAHGAGQSSVLVFADCDSLDGWQKVKIGSTYVDEINTSVKTRGLGSIGCEVDNAPFLYSTEMFLLYYEADRGMDISNMTHFAFDMYVEDAAAFEGNHFTVEIGSTLQLDVNELQSKGLRFVGLKDGWNHIELELDAMKMYEPAASFDPTNTIRFRFYNGDGSGTYSGLLLFDNFYFTNDPVGEMVS